METKTKLTKVQAAEVELAGADLGVEMIQQINSQFAYNQAALRALQTVYKARGISYDGGLDKQIYQAEGAIQQMADVAYAAFYREGSLNQLAHVVNKYAFLEGYEGVNRVPDQVGLDQVTARAAGLAQ